MKLMLTEEIEEIVGCTREDIYKFIQEGMPHFKVGNHFRFVQDEVEVWIADYKPLQERLEEEFVDAKGRTLQEYTTTETILDFFRISQQTMYTLCKKGMPYEKVGTKRFFQLEDVIEYFRRGENVNNPQKEVVAEKKNSNENEIPTLFVVDGSYHPMMKSWGAGLVSKKGTEAKGYTYGEKNKKTNSKYAEYQAIMQAMKIIQKENIKHAVIATDQITFVSTAKLEILGTEKWMKKGPAMIELTKEFQETYIDTKRMCSLRFVYYKNLRSVYKDINDTELKHMYYHSHDLSRVYEETEPITIDLSVQKANPKNKPSKVLKFAKKTSNESNEIKKTNLIPIHSKEDHVQVNQKHSQVTISFIEKKDKYAHFAVMKDGKKHVTRMDQKNITIALFSVGYAFAKTLHPNTKIILKKTPNFEGDLTKFFKNGKESIIKKHKDIFSFLVNKENVTLDMPYEAFKKEFEIEENKQECM